MFTNYLPTNLAKNLTDGSKKLGEEVIFFILNLLLRFFILLSLCLYVFSFGKIDLIKRFIEKF